MLKIFEALTQKQIGEVAIAPKLIKASFSSENATATYDRETQYQWKTGIEIAVAAIGPGDAGAELRRQAMLFIAREIYEELEGDIRDAYEIACMESYRKQDDPLLIKLNEITAKMRGET